MYKFILALTVVAIMTGCTVNKEDVNKLVHKPVIREKKEVEQKKEVQEKTAVQEDKKLVQKHPKKKEKTVVKQPVEQSKKEGKKIVEQKPNIAEKPIVEEKPKVTEQKPVEPEKPIAIDHINYKRIDVPNKPYYKRQIIVITNRPIKNEMEFLTIRSQIQRQFVVGDDWKWYGSTVIVTDAHNYSIGG
ncbi:hypothetical protein QNK12_15655 [Neobacillus cucumis]|nr:hypothetical protein QNK12_15655 [Neobacillus cucumis]